MSANAIGVWCIAVAGCANSIVQSVDKSMVAPAGVLDPMRSDQVCALLGLPAGCDVCQALGWYGDGTCDAFCPMPDPDCRSQLVGAPASVESGGAEIVTVHDTAEGRHDWVGLFAVGESNTDATSVWLYLNGAQQPPAAPIPDTDLMFTIPSTLAPGPYQWRLEFDDGVTGYSLGATSPTITVGAP